MTASIDLGFDAAVLCGGGSRRMGTDKALVEIDGTAMARRVALALEQAGSGTVLAIGGDRPALTALGLPVVSDRWPGEGPLGGLVTALTTPGAHDLVAVLSCDLVHPDPTEVTRLVAQLSASGRDAVIPRVDGRPQWLHGVWHRRVGGVLEAVFAAGERSMFGAVHGLEIDIVAVVDGRAYDDADRPSDLPDRH